MNWHSSWDLAQHNKTRALKQFDEANSRKGYERGKVENLPGSVQALGREDKKNALVLGICALLSYPAPGGLPTCTSKRFDEANCRKGHERSKFENLRGIAQALGWEKMKDELVIGICALFLSYPARGE